MNANLRNHLSFENRIYECDVLSAIFGKPQSENYMKRFHQRLSINRSALNSLSWTLVSVLPILKLILRILRVRSILNSVGKLNLFSVRVKFTFHQVKKIMNYEKWNEKVWKNYEYNFNHNSRISMELVIDWV